MSKRFTETGKWDDKWFRGLTPGCKLMFLFITDKCDLAGFYEIDTEDIAFRTGLQEDKILGAIKGLSRGLMVKGDWVWMRKLLHHQKNLPLNPENNAHNHIIKCVAEKLSMFPEVPKEIGAKKGLFSPIGIGRGIGKGKGTVTQEQKKRMKVDGNTPHMIEIGSWFGRQADTMWSLYEATALEEVNPSDKDLVALRGYYTATISEDDDIRRRNIETLLNNWQSEIDRAHKYAKVKTKSAKSFTSVR